MRKIMSSELVSLTVATYRQIDHWCSLKIIELAEDRYDNKSGYYRWFNEDIVPRVKLLVKIQRVFGGRLAEPTLKKIYNGYDEGLLVLCDGLELRWDTDE